MASAAVLQRQRSARREKRRRELEQRRAKQQQQQQQRKDDEYTPSPKTLGLELVASPVMLAKNTIDDSITSNGGDDDEPSNFIDIPLTDDKDNEVQEEEEFIIVDKRKSGGSSNKHGYISRDGTLTSNVELELICATPEKKCMLIEKGEQVINLQSTEVQESSSTFDDEYPIDELERNNSIRRGNTLTSKESQLLSMMNHYEGSSPDLVLDDETYDYSDDGDDISTVINYSSSEYNNTSAWYMNVLDSLCECAGQYLPEEDVSDLISCSDDSEWS